MNCKGSSWLGWEWNNDGLPFINISKKLIQTLLLQHNCLGWCYAPTAWSKEIISLIWGENQENLSKSNRETTFSTWWSPIQVQNIGIFFYIGDRLASKTFYPKSLSKCLLSNYSKNNLEIGLLTTWRISRIVSFRFFRVYYRKHEWKKKKKKNLFFQ